MNPVGFEVDELGRGGHHFEDDDGRHFHDYERTPEYLLDTDDYF